MSGPPGPRRAFDTVSRGSREKQPRAFDGARRVRIIGENDMLIGSCSQDEARRYLSAPNAEIKKAADGSIKYIRLLALGDDRGHTGEGRGRSTVTTERVRNDWGELVGGDTNLQHKRTCTSWGAPAVPTQSRNTNNRD